MEMTNKIFARIYINIALITVAVTAFFFIAGARPEALQDNIFGIQLVLSTPLILSSTLLLGKAMTAKHQEEFVEAANWFFVIGYAMLINSIGIFIAQITGIIVAFTFFAAHIISTLIYSWIVMGAEGDSAFHRAKKDIPFIALIILLGMLPAV